MGVERERRVPGTKRASSGDASSTASHFSTSARSSLQTSLSTILLTRATPLLSRSWPRSFDGFNGVATAASAASLPGLAAGLVVAERAAAVARSGSRACILWAAAFCKSAHVRRVASGQPQQAAACTLRAAVSHDHAHTQHSSCKAWLLSCSCVCLVSLSSVRSPTSSYETPGPSPACLPSARPFKFHSALFSL